MSQAHLLVEIQRTSVPLINKVNTIFSLLLTISFLASIETYAQISAQLLDEIEALSKSYFPEQDPGAVILVGLKGEIVFHEAYGMANLELNVPNNKDMVFAIASNTKQFTALGILQLVEEGKLYLDDTLSKYFEDLPEQKQGITIKQLLWQTSGLEDVQNKKFYNAHQLMRIDLSPDTLLGLTKNDTLLFNPGQEFHYSNTNFTFLGKIIEKISGEPLNDWFQKNLFDKVGMQNTFSYSNEAESLIINRSNGYRKDSTGFLNKEFLSYTQMFAAGSILTNASDLFKWYNAVFDNKVVPDYLLSETITSGVLTDGRKTGYGYGYFITPISGIITANHGGKVPGYFVNSIYEAKKDLCVIVLSNWEYSPAFKLSFQIASKLLNELYHLEINVGKEEVIGTYIKDSHELRIIEESGSILLVSNGAKDELYPSGQNQYYFGNVLPGILMFNKDVSGTVTGLTVKWYFSSFSDYKKTSN